MFDCVMPTRNARHGLLFTKNGLINIKNEKWKNDFSVIEENGASEVDTRYTKAYLRHLLVCGEQLAAQIASLHNLAFYLWLVKEARKHIIAGTFAAWKKETVEKVSQRL
jgi:queuine tRNA-ribosyltransferase